MDNDLFNSLRKYKKTDKLDPIENFITEAFAWLLKNYPKFSSYFLNEIRSEINSQNFIPDNVSWYTQKNFNGVFPDMVCEYDKCALIFEHKAWKKLSDGQLAKYKKFGNENYQQNYLILITGTEKHHEQNPDLALCWYNIHRIIDHWLDNKNDSNNYFIFRSFQNLLVQEGMGPAAPISYNSILSYYSARSFENDVFSLTTRIFKKEISNFKRLFKNEKKDFELGYNKNKILWGRIGFSLFSYENWLPGFFVGIMVDGSDHFTNPVNGKYSNPDFTINLSFHKSVHSVYSINKNYIELVKYLEDKIRKLNKGWDFYHHIKDDDAKVKNYYHPIHIRKPMLELLRGTMHSEEQENRFMEAVNEILPIILNSEHYINLKNDLKEVMKEQE